MRLRVRRRDDRDNRRAGEELRRMEARTNVTEVGHLSPVHLRRKAEETQVR